MKNILYILLFITFSAKAGSDEIFIQIDNLQKQEEAIFKAFDNKNTNEQKLKVLFEKIDAINEKRKELFEQLQIEIDKEVKKDKPKEYIKKLKK